ncbi:hypothetical protein CDAR_469091 [Caerostris darwini]|uniref:Uncharacterized protein n=1 Tax=Caerostris darwini TaxID=1538125 RepID=A0AAV4VFP5_9ARAC|nr:hypothetical protein CDAR_469091 [Caerostris darwini]
MKLYNYLFSDYLHYQFHPIFTTHSVHFIIITHTTHNLKGSHEARPKSLLTRYLHLHLLLTQASNGKHVLQHREIPACTTIVNIHYEHVNYCIIDDDWMERSFQLFHLPHLNPPPSLLQRTLSCEKDKRICEAFRAKQHLSSPLGEVYKSKPIHN